MLKRSDYALMLLAAIVGGAAIGAMYGHALQTVFWGVVVVVAMGVLEIVSAGVDHIKYCFMVQRNRKRF